MPGTWRAGPEVREPAECSPCRLWSLDGLGLRAAGGYQALRRSTASVREMAVASGEDDLRGDCVQCTVVESMSFGA